MREGSKEGGGEGRGSRDEKQTETRVPIFSLKPWASVLFKGSPPNGFITSQENHGLVTHI